MEVITHTTGTNAGKISVVRTIGTMAPGETWSVEEGLVSLAYAYSACSRLSRMSSDRSFSVKSPAEYGGMIEISCKEKNL